MRTNDLFPCELASAVDIDAAGRNVEFRIGNPGISTEHIIRGDSDEAYAMSAAGSGHIGEPTALIFPAEARIPSRTCRRLSLQRNEFTTSGLTISHLLSKICASVISVSGRPVEMISNSLNSREMVRASIPFPPVRSTFISEILCSASHAELMFYFSKGRSCVILWPTVAAVR